MNHERAHRWIGIMQGRFTDKGGFYPQQFPWKEWEQEFYIATECGLNCIEWMFNAERFEDNPIWTRSGRKEICRVMRNTGVLVRSICANYFMQYTPTCSESMEVFRRLLDAGEELGAEHIVLPLFESSGELREYKLMTFSEQLIDCMIGRKIKTCFESDLPIDDQIRVCAKSTSGMVGICYDVGNATGNGYCCMEDISKAKKYLFEVHFKDKERKGTSVMLGNGDVDFPGVLRELKNFSCLRIFESYFGENALADTKRNVDYIRRLELDD